MFELKNYLGFLLKATILACAAIACAWVLYQAARVAISRQARADFMYSVGLAPSATLPPSPDDDAIWASVGSESNAILNWVQFCAGIDDPYKLPVLYQLYFVNQSRPPPDGPVGHLPNRLERSLLELNIAANRQRFAMAK